MDDAEARAYQPRVVHVDADQPRSSSSAPTRPPRLEGMAGDLRPRRPDAGGLTVAGGRPAPPAGAVPVELTALIPAGTRRRDGRTSIAL